MKSRDESNKSLSNKPSCPGLGEKTRRNPGEESANSSDDVSSQETSLAPIHTIKDGIVEKQNSKTKSKSRGFWRALKETLITLLIAAIIALFLQSFCVRAFMIPSSSMNPTFEIGDRIMVEKVTYYFRKPRRGDIIVFRYPPSEPESMNTNNPFYWPFEQIAEVLHLAHRGSTPYVKRVIAVEGETLRLREGILYINGKRISERYAILDSSDYGPFKVPKGMVFCLGDNRPNSKDSRYIGPVPVRSIIGRVFVRWWPPSRFGFP